MQTSLVAQNSSRYWCTFACVRIHRSPGVRLASYRRLKVFRLHEHVELPMNGHRSEPINLVVRQHKRRVVVRRRRNRVCAQTDCLHGVLGLNQVDLDALREHGNQVRERKHHRNWRIRPLDAVLSRRPALKVLENRYIVPPEKNFLLAWRAGSQSTFVKAMPHQMRCARLEMGGAEILCTAAVA
jgi:hypothetical protein